MGVTSVSDDDKEKPQCVLCYAVLSNEAMKPSELKRHLQQKHPEHMEKDLSFFQRQKFQKQAQRKFSKCHLSNDTIKRRISLMSTDVKQQVMHEIKASPLFSIQLDESVDVASCSQLLVDVR